MFANQTPKPSTDSLGCAASQLLKDQQLDGPGFTLYRKHSAGSALNHISTPASARGFLLGIALNGGHRRRILRGRHADCHDFASGAIYLRRFAEDYRADLIGAFDFLLLEISRGYFDHPADELAAAQVRDLDCVTGAQDPVLAHLAQALLPALERPREASPLFIDQMGVVIRTHLAERYGGAGSAERERKSAARLSLRQEARAKELLSQRLDGALSIAEIAQACGLSRSHFTRAFRATTGQTPHQWLQAQRIATACALLQRGQMNLVEIAALCGFADQSHFTRAFTQAKGQPPGRWRRHAQT